LPSIDIDRYWFSLLLLILFSILIDFISHYFDIIFIFSFITDISLFIIALQYFADIFAINISLIFFFHYCIAFHYFSLSLSIIFFSLIFLRFHYYWYYIIISYTFIAFITPLADIR
jgi:hypothetical protein